MNFSELENKIKSDGFNNEKIETIKNVIHFVGIAENLAWRESEGVLREDVAIKKTILNFMINNGIINETISKYQKYPIYQLNKEYYEVFNEIDYQFQSKNFDSFLSEFNKINLNMLCLIGESYFKNAPIEHYDISNWDSEDDIDYTLLLRNSNKGELIYKEFNRVMFEFMNLIDKYKYYYEITPFQSNRREHKRNKFINNSRIINILKNNTLKFKKLYGNEIRNLNRKVMFYSSIEMPLHTIDLRIFLNDTEFSKEFYEISDKLSKEKLIAPIEFEECPFLGLLNQKNTF